MRLLCDSYYGDPCHVTRRAARRRYLTRVSADGWRHSRGHVTLAPRSPIGWRASRRDAFSSKALNKLGPVAAVCFGKVIQRATPPKEPQAERLFSTAGPERKGVTNKKSKGRCTTFGDNFSPPTKRRRPIKFRRSPSKRYTPFEHATDRRLDTRTAATV